VAFTGHRLDSGEAVSLEGKFDRRPRSPHRMINLIPASNSPDHGFAMPMPAVPARATRGTSFRYGYLLLAASLAAFVIGLYCGTGLWALASYMAAAASACGAFYVFLIRGVGQSYSPKVLFFVNAMAPGNMFVFCLFSSLGGDHLFPWEDVLFSKPLQSAVGLLSVPLGVACVYFFKHVVRGRTTSGPSFDLTWLRDAGGNKLQLFLILAAFVNLSIWFAVLDIDNPVFYFLRILRTALSLGALAAGLCAFRFKWATLAWIISISLGLLGSLLTGGRGYGFIPTALFLLGMLLGARSKRVQFRLILLMVPAAFFLLVLSGYIGSLRDVTGRKDISMVLEDGSILEGEDDLFSNAGMIEEDSFIFRGLRRIMSWPPAVVSAMTPDPIPCRGFRDMPIEFQDAFSLRIFQLAAAGGRRGELESYWGKIFLLPYGFAVSESSSVEFGILSDGYTRGGWWAAFVYGIIATIILFALEGGLRRLLLPSKSAVFAMLLCVLCGYAAITFQLNPLVAVIRTIVLNTVFVLAVCLVLDAVLSIGGYESTARSKLRLPTR
jgi:hypothetical protein